MEMTPDQREHSVPYELMPHTGDLAMRVSGSDLPTLFLNAARALFDVMTVPPHEVTVERSITLDAGDPESLLVDWLNELICLHETEGETYTRFVLEEFSPTHLSARVSGGLTVEKALVVKAATYHDLQIISSADGVEATIVFDI